MKRAMQIGEQAKSSGVLQSSGVHHKIYEVDPPMKWFTCEPDGEGGYYAQEHETRFVVVSAAAPPFMGPETYIFPSGEKGQIIDWKELNGSFRGALDHKRALSNAGYTIVDEL